MSLQNICPRCKKEGIFLGQEYEYTRRTRCHVCGSIIGQDELESFLRTLVEQQKESLRKARESHRKALEPGFLERLAESFFSRKPNIEKLKQKRNIKGLIKLLHYEGDKERGKAAQALGELKDQQAVEPLVAALKDGRSQVREAATKALGEISDMRALTPLIRTLIDKDVNVRNAAVYALRRIDSNWAETELARDAIPEFIAALKDKDYSVRRRAAEALGQFRDKGVTESLVAALKEPDSYVWEAIWDALKKINSNWARSEAARAAIPELVAALKDGNSKVRGAAAHALGEIGDSQAMEPLVAMLKDEHNRDIYSKVEEALKRIDPNWAKSEVGKHALPEFVVALNDKNSYVRWTAAKTLGKIGDSRAVESLVATLNDEDEDVFAAAISALQEIDPNWMKSEIGMNAVPSFLTALKNKNRSVREAAAKVLGDIGDSRAVEPLVATLKDEYRDVRKAAAKALDTLSWQPLDETERTLFALLTAEDISIDELNRIILKDPHPLTRREALERFIDGNEPVEVMFLTRIACTSANSDIRERALQRLIDKGNAARAKSLIIGGREELNAEERGWAAEALLKLGL